MLSIVFSLAIGLYSTLALAGGDECFDKRNNPTVTIDSGAVMGTITLIPESDVAVHKYLGIPFAKPPPRFSPPEPIESWHPATLNATAHGSYCYQSFRRKWFMAVANEPPPPDVEDEDCLNINVWTPVTKSTELKPVMLWMFGGSFQFGTGSWPIYDGTSFAANQDILLVTYNYRTNVFGFPASPDIPDDEVNLGFLDSRLALDWVHRNIKAFGGDPEKVTIFGESAGAGVADTLILAPPDPLPFRAAILQSATATFIASDLAPRGKVWKQLLKAVNCPEKGEEAVQCLRKIPAGELRDRVQGMDNLFNAVPGVKTWPSDGRQRRLNSTKENSLIARVPIMIGSTADEGQSFMYGTNQTTVEFLKKMTGGKASEEQINQVLDMYAIGQPGIPNEFEQTARIMGEISFNAPSFGVAEESASVGIPTWHYLYNSSIFEPKIYEGSGAYHSSEIRPIFGTYNHTGATEEHHTISRVMQKAWADFAKDPNRGPGWNQVPAVGVFGFGQDGRKPFGTDKLLELYARCKFWLNLIAPLK